MSYKSLPEASLNNMLFKYGFNSKTHFLEFLEKVPQERFQSQGLDAKPRLIYQIRLLMQYIEMDAMVLSEARTFSQ